MTGEMRKIIGFGNIGRNKHKLGLTSITGLAPIKYGHFYSGGKKIYGIKGYDIGTERRSKKHKYNRLKNRREKIKNRINKEHSYLSDYRIEIEEGKRSTRRRNSYKRKMNKKRKTDRYSLVLSRGQRWLYSRKID